MSLYGKILITGGLGFIGINIVKKIILTKNFSQIIIIDNTNEIPTYNREIINNDRTKYLKGSVLDNGFLDTLPNDFDYIIHCAGILGVKKVGIESVHTLDVNILGTKNCLELCKRQVNLKRFLAFSSSEIYGTDASFLNEKKPAIIPTIGVRWCYAVSKIALEQYTKAYYREFKIPYTIVRPFNVYGPYRNGTNAVTNFISKALKNDPIQITGDGSQRRSWCYIDDFVIGVLEGLVNENGRNETFNIGNPDNSVSIHELGKIIIEKTLSRSDIIILRDLDRDVDNRQPNILKAKKLLNYKPIVSLEEGLQKTIEWIQSLQL